MEETVKTEVVNNTTQNKGNKNFNKDRKPRKEFKKNFEPKKFKFAPKDHEALLLQNDLIDFDRATKVAASKFYYFKNNLSSFLFSSL